MDRRSFELAAKIVTPAYAEQAEQQRRATTAYLNALLTHKKMPKSAADEPTIRVILAEIAAMDSNNYAANAGVGEREGRVLCPLVRDRHFGLAHGVGRSGDVTEPQPKAAGSSLIYKLTNELAADAIRRAGAPAVSEAVVLPLATGMAMTLVLLALRRARPEARYVIWPRIDQKSCLKAITAAGLTPVPIANVREGDELRTDVAAIGEAIERLGNDAVLCVLTTTSCFAPRAVDRLLDVARLCDAAEVPHVANNAYGLQCALCMRAIAAASRHGRLDAFVQSTDKNFLVPVGGSVVAAGSDSHGGPLLAAVRSTYPGRASIAPILDLFITLLHLGGDGWERLLAERREALDGFRARLAELAQRHGERLLETPGNSISMAITLTPPPGAKAPSALGGALFVRLVSGARVVAPSDEAKEVGGCSFVNYGAHTDDYGVAYLSVACALGIRAVDVDLAFKRIDKQLAEWKFVRSPVRPLLSPDAIDAE